MSTEDQPQAPSFAGLGISDDVLRAINDLGWQDPTPVQCDSYGPIVSGQDLIVQSRTGGALKKSLPLFRLGLGGKFGSGEQYMSWITIDDEVGIISWLLESDVSGAVNLTAPEPVTNAAYTKALGKALGRPTFMPIPKFGPKLLLGGELTDALLYTGQRVLPEVAEASGYKFQHPTVDAALDALL